MSVLTSMGSRVQTLTVALAACTSMLGGMAHAESKGTVHLAYVEWSSNIASTNVARVVLEKAGYDVKTTSLAAAVAWQATKTHDADAFLGAWLPTSQADYAKQIGDAVVDLGPNLDGTKLGLAVPAYSEANSIEDLNDHADAFNREIIGIDPGAGIQRLTEQAVKDYGLTLKLRDGSDATMTAALGNAIKRHEDIVVTAWTPHWMFARWDLKYLDDPKGVYGGAEQIHTIARKGLKEDLPGAYKILDNFYWAPDDMGKVLLMNEAEGSDPYENAKKWVDENPEKVKQWLGES
ncbi:glycine betaine ABC transporter substrate-binding protein [Allopusillimonas ginsengisoli]|uniref:glycine betaine ABC transporter substrate-binding protein n=1 Tax=Allopusillimonas ginsengisoli TaxID=453575 RepID=UPI0010C1609E|nr:glycine betaine ABC transporter substrate-binding protein [Allopusillimonas ginsengisoli]